MSPNNTEIQINLDQGIKLHNSGDLDGAQQVYQKILTLSPKHSDAHNLLGAVETQRGNFKRGIELINAALSFNPGNAGYYLNLGNAFFSNGQLPESEASYRSAIDLNPEYTDAIYNLARVLDKQEKFSEALKFYRQVMQHCPDHEWAPYYAGEVALQLNSKQEAIKFFELVVKAKPNFFEALRRLGSLYHDCELLDRAKLILQKALTFKVDDIVLLARLGIICQTTNDLEAAVDYYLDALRFKPDYPEVLGNLSGIYREQGKFDLGLECANRALRAEPDNQVYLNNYGNLLLKLNRFADARKTFSRIIKLAPDFSMAYVNLSAVCLADHKLEDAIKYNQKALRLNPDDVHANWNQALLELHAGNFKAGFRQYEYRWEKSDFLKIKREYSQPRWDGTPQPDKSLLIWAEQGFGDTIQFIRYLELVKPLFKNVIVEVQPALVSLTQTCPWVDRVIPAGDIFNEFDFHLPLLSLPQFFTNAINSIPNQVPYLSASGKENTFIENLSIKSNPAIGINWAGSPTHENDHNRSIPLEMFTPLFKNADVQYFSLQMGSRRAELAGLADDLRPIELTPKIKDFYDTALIIDKLDLIITVDTALAHLAGALGKTVWVLVPWQSDWRWLYDRADSPWYPTLRLFRQDRSCDWEKVLVAVSDALKRLDF